MSTTTTNYGLIKPDTTDPILIGQLNDNSDAIDAALKENADAIENKPDAADIPSPSTAAPAMDGTAAAGTSTDYARADHVHPSDTSKQDALTTAQLAAANSGIDSAKVEQIETNKNNILLSEQMNGAKNLLKFDEWANTVGVYNGTKSVSGNTISLTSTGAGAVTLYNASDFPARCKIPVNVGDVLVFTWDTTYTGSGAYIQICANGTAASGTEAQLKNKILVYTVPSGTTYVTWRLGIYSAVGITVDCTDMMIQSKASYDAGFTDYQPYAMSNAELTAGVSNWDSYDCLDQTHPNDIDINNSELTVYHNAFLKRVVISCKIKFLLQRTSASTALLIGNMVNIPNYTKLIPLNSVREFVSTPDYDAFIAKNATNYAIAFAVNSGTLAANTEIRAQFEYTYF